MSEKQQSDLPQKPQKNAEECETIASDLEARILYRSESGAFEAKIEDRDRIIELINKARQLNSTDTAAAKSDLLQASVLLTDINRQMGLKWRMVHIWGVLPFSYFMFFVLISIYVTFQYTAEILEIYILDVPLAAVIYAFMGGLLRGLWWLIKKVESKRFRPQFTIPYFAGPWIAALLGVLVWLLVKAGLIFLGGGESDPRPLAVYSLVFIGGFSWEWVIAMIDKVKANTLK